MGIRNITADILVAIPIPQIIEARKKCFVLDKYNVETKIRNSKLSVVPK
jgi:hypothetical protein